MAAQSVACTSRNTGSRDPYRIIVWGTGGMGKVAISTIAARQDFEIVGARVYSADKDGADIGTLAGVAPMGVSATTDIDAALASDADCVVHLARDFGRYDSLDEIVTMLRRGHNVITVHPFQIDHAMSQTVCPSDAMVRIAQACQEGGSTFHSTGIHPELVAVRLVGTLTGLSTDITAIKVSENWDVRDRDARTLTLMGYGSAPASLETKSAGIAKFTDNYGLQSLYGLSRLLGFEPARIEYQHEYAPAPVDLSFRDMQIPVGSVARLTRRILGFRGRHDDVPFVTAEVNWMVGRKEMVPAGMDPEHHYIAVIEGTPSLSVGLGIKASMFRDQRLMDPDDPSSDPGYWATIATVLQAVPRVCDAQPGILGRCCQIFTGCGIFGTSRHTAAGEQLWNSASSQLRRDRLGDQAVRGGLPALDADVGPSLRHIMSLWVSIIVIAPVPLPPPYVYEPSILDKWGEVLVGQRAVVNPSKIVAPLRESVADHGGLMMRTVAIRRSTGPTSQGLTHSLDVNWCGNLLY